MRNQSSSRFSWPFALSALSKVRVDTVFCLLILCGGLIMVGIDRVDQAWTLWLQQHKWSYLTDTMGQTLFEGERFGGGDPSTLFLIVVFCCYLLSIFMGNCKRLVRCRPQVGFILIAAFWSCLCIVHTLKWLVGRARPLLIYDGLPYSHWYEFGPHFITQGVYNGSFPSGHTALAFIFMALAYVLAGDERHSKRTRISGVFVGLFTIFNALLMGVARTMSVSHWVSDICASILFSWVTIHMLYYHILRIPNLTQSNSHTDAPPFWELKLCFYQLLVVLGFLAFMIGIRAIIEQDGMFLMAMIPPGIFIFKVFWKHSMSVYSRGTGGFK